MTSFDENLIHQSNILLGGLMGVLLTWDLPRLEAMREQYSLAKAASVVFMAHGADMEWLGNVTDKIRALDLAIEMKKLQLKGGQQRG